MLKIINEFKMYWRNAKVARDLAKKTKVALDAGKVSTQTIYGDKLKPSYIASIQSRILGTLKYLFITPLISIGNLIAGKHLIKEVPDSPHLVNIRIFDKSWQEAEIECIDVMSWGSVKGNPLKFFKSFVKSNSIKLLRKIKYLGLTALISDTWYIEFMNILMFKITKNMVEYHGTNPVHILYKSPNINDTAYFVVNKQQNNLVLKERIKRLETYLDKDGKFKVKQNQGARFTLRLLANELTVEPTQDNIIKAVDNLIQQNNQMYNFLININQSIVNNLTNNKK